MAKSKPFVISKSPEYKFTAEPPPKVSAKKPVVSKSRPDVAVKKIKIVKKPKKLDYFLQYSNGTLDQEAPMGRQVVKAYCVDSNGNKPDFESQPGFGFTKVDAIEDFIRRNKSSVLEKIWS